MQNFDKEKMDLYTYYLSHYNTDDMLGFCKIALNKHRMENYSMNDNDIIPSDMIVNNNNVRHFISEIVNQNSCSEKEFEKVFGLLTVDQIYTIGI